MRFSIQLLTAAAMAAVCECRAGIGFVSWDVEFKAVKSAFLPGPAAKSQIRHAFMRNRRRELRMTTKMTTPDDRESTVALVIKEDGKSYSVSGNPEFDLQSVTKFDANRKRDSDKSGCHLRKTIRTMSKDGKTLTFKQRMCCATKAGNAIDQGKYIVIWRNDGQG